MFANSFCAAENLNTDAEKLLRAGKNLQRKYNEPCVDEYRAFCYRAYNAVKNHKRNSKPFAIILDVNETILLSTPFFSSYVGTGKTFDARRG